MPWNDTDYQNAALDALWGDSRGPNTCATFELGLLTGDPRLGGVEITGGGYARIAAANANTFWQDAANRLKRSLVQTFPTPTGLWDIATHDGIWADVGGVMTLIDFAPLDRKVVADAGDPAPTVQIARRWNVGLA